MRKIARKEGNGYVHKFLIAILVLNIAMFGVAVFTLKSPKIVTLDTQYIIKSLAQELAKEELEQEALERILKEKIERMDASVLKLSKDKGYVVLSKAAVVSPCIDITETVMQEVRDVK